MPASDLGRILALESYFLIVAHSRFVTISRLHASCPSTVRSSTRRSHFSISIQGVVEVTVRVFLCLSVVVCMLTGSVPLSEVE